MSTSGSIDFNPNRDEIINGAFRLCSVISTGETATSKEVDDASEALNMMIKSWAAKGIGLWAQQECTLFLQPSQVIYKIGNTSSGDNCTTTHVETTTTGDEAILATVIGVTLSTGMTAGDYVGIVLDSGVVHWTTIVTVDSSVQITITTGIVSAASSGATVYAYTTKIDRPLQIVEARHRAAGSSGTDIVMSRLDRSDYMALPMKTSTGTPNSFFWDPQLTLGELRIWPASSDADTTLRMSVQRTIEDFDSASNTPDFPQEWVRTLKYALAAEIALEYDVPLDKMDRLKVLSEQYLAESRGEDSNMTSVYFFPGYANN